MDERFSRTASLLGEVAMKKLESAHVAVFGLGGVGSYAAMALARSGVGKLTLVDHDVVVKSNLNRQLMAFLDTEGMPKTLALAAEIRRVRPEMALCLESRWIDQESLAQWDFSGYDYILDCVDTVTAKLHLALKAKAEGKAIIACMGMGNKTDPTQIFVGDLDKTTVCPLARVMRKELGKRGVKHMRVVYSKEESDTPMDTEARFSGRPSPASLMTVPAAAGLIMAGAVIQEISKGANGED